MLSAGVGTLDAGIAVPWANDIVATKATIDMKVAYFILILLQKPCQHSFRLSYRFFLTRYSHNIDYSRKKTK